MPPEDMQDRVKRLLSHIQDKPLFGHLQQILAPQSPVRKAPGAQGDMGLLFAACLGVLGPLPDPPPDQARQAAMLEASRMLLLAVLTVVRANARGSRLAGRDRLGLVRLVKPCSSRLKLFEKAAELSSWTAADLAADMMKYERICKVVSGFQDAIARRRLRSVVWDEERLSARLANYMGLGDLSDDQVRAHAESVFRTVPNMTDDDAAGLLNTIPPATLRTYPDSMLSTIARNFLLWEPLVRYLSDRVLQAAKGDALWERLSVLLNGVKGKVRAKFGGDLSEKDIEDAIQHALAQAASPDCSYLYEGGFPDWLISVVINHIKALLKRRMQPISEEPKSEPGVPGPRWRPSDYVEFLHSWQERYLLVETFFQAAKRDRVKQIWAAMLSHYRIDEELSDRQLAQRISAETGERIGERTLAGVRRRLRQRFDAMTYVLEEAPRHRLADLPGDASVLAWVDAQWGLGRRDVPTLRHLAAFARACQEEETFIWALFARLAVDFNTTPDDIQHEIGLSLQARREALGLSGPNPLDSRFQAAVAFIRDKSRMAELRKVRQAARRDGGAFFVSPTWYLAVLRRLAGGSVGGVLKPMPGAEKEFIECLIARLKNIFAVGQ